MGRDEAASLRDRRSVGAVRESQPSPSRTTSGAFVSTGTRRSIDARRCNGPLSPAVLRTTQVSRLRRPRDSRECRCKRLGLMAGDEEESGCASELKGGRNRRCRSDVGVDVVVASYLPRECSPENGPLAFCSRSGPKARAAQRRASRVAAETRSRRLPLQDVLSVREDDLRWIDGARERRDAIRSVHVHFPLRFYRPACVRNVRSLVQRSFSFSLVRALSRFDDDDDDDDDQRPRRRVPDFASLASVSSRGVLRRSKREKEKNDNG